VHKNSFERVPRLRWTTTKGSRDKRRGCSSVAPIVLIHQFRGRRAQVHIGCRLECTGTAAPSTIRVSTISAIT